MSSKKRLSSEEELKFRRSFWRDPKQFIERYLKIQPKDTTKGLVLLNLNEAQRIVYKKIQELRAAGLPVRLVILKARQMGISTFIEGLLFAMARLNMDTNCLIVSHSVSSAKRIYQMSQLFLDNLPPAIRPMVSSRTQSLTAFANPDEQRRPVDPGLRSQIQIGTAKNVDIGASFTFHGVHVSEVARWADAEATMTSIMNSVPYLANTFVAVESTAQGMGGYFYDLWQRAVSGKSEWTPIFLPWWIFKEYELKITVEERQKLLDTLTEDERWLLKEFTPAMTLEKLAWRRKTIDIECHGKVSTFKQEYPSCVVYNTRVSTENGIIPIGDTLAGQSAKSESGPIKAWGPTGRSIIWEMVTAKGRKLEGTHDHPVKLASGEWRWLAHLQPGDCVQLRPPMFAEQVYEVEWHPIPGFRSALIMDERWASFLGYYLGDGYWAKTGVGIACDAKDQDTVAEVTDLITSITGAPVNYKEVSMTKGRAGCTYVNGCGGAPFREVMKVLGVIHESPEGSKSSGYLMKNLRVPECIWRSPKHIVKEFLSALFECDAGHRNKNAQTVFYTKSQDFARDVQLLLLGFGISAPIKEITKKAGNGTTYIGYEMCLNRANTDAYNQGIGFRSARKRARLPVTEETRATRGRPPDPISMEDTVVSVRCTDRTEEVYDLTIEGSHEFSANGIVTHNTAEEAFLASGTMVFEPEAIKYHLEFARDGRRGRLVRDKRTRKVHFVADKTGPLTVWKPPRRGEDYVISGDPSQGMTKRKDGKAGDYAASCVLSNRMEQVAELQDHMEPHDFADYLDMLGRWYNTALVFPEVSGYGGGYSVQYTLQYTLRYPRLGVMPHWDQVGVKDSQHVGFHPNGMSVPILISKMVREVHRAAGILLPSEMLDKVEDEKPETHRLSHSQRQRQRLNYKLRIYSRELCNEMTSYIVRDNGDIGAAGRGKDDLVRALGIAILALEQIPPPSESDPLMKTLGKMPAMDYDERGVPHAISGGSNFPDWI